MSRCCTFRSVAVVLAICFAPLAALADDVTPCAKQLRAQLVIAKVAPDVCLTTSALVPARAVVLALWATDPDSPSEIPLAAVLDRAALENGHRQYLYKRHAHGESLGSFLFNGKSAQAAIADFDGSGRTGWAMWVIPDADYAFDITIYDPRTKKFIEPGNDGPNDMTFPAGDLDAEIQVTKGQVLVPVCGTSGGTYTHPAYGLSFEVYRLQNGHYEKGRNIPATGASAAERKKCAMTAAN
jgi:hypothetical protein